VTKRIVIGRAMTVPEDVVDLDIVGKLIRSLKGGVDAFIHHHQPITTIDFRVLHDRLISTVHPQRFNPRQTLTKITAFEATDAMQAHGTETHNVHAMRMGIGGKHDRWGTDSAS
jgi:hypothetical protein